jgi:putative membrane protein
LGNNRGIHPRVKNRRLHLANERTFLAWVRTSIGIMALGFVVEKFSIFVKSVAILSGRQVLLSGSSKHSSILGVFLVALGGMMGLLAFIRYKKVERQIDEDLYKPSILLDILLASSIVTIALFLIFYMIRTI